MAKILIIIINQTEKQQLLSADYGPSVLSLPSSMGPSHSRLRGRRRSADRNCYFSNSI